MNPPLDGKRVLIRNIDLTDSIESIRLLPENRIGIVFKGAQYEYKYNSSNITFIDSSEKETAATTTNNEFNKKIIIEEQQILDIVIEKVNEVLERVNGHIPYLSPLYGTNPKHRKEVYLNFLKNPYFAKMKFIGDDNSYYISEHNINSFSSDIDLPKNIKIISVYSDLGRHIYDRSASFIAKRPLGKKLPLGNKISRYNPDGRMNSTETTTWHVIEKLRFNIRNKRIIEVKDETPR